ncbi:MAG: CHAT domain-containing protein [Chitinophagales bacterium]
MSTTTYAPFFCLIVSIVLSFAFDDAPSVPPPDLEQAEQLLIATEQLIANDEFESVIENLSAAKVIFSQNKAWKQTISCLNELVDYHLHLSQLKESEICIKEAFELVKNIHPYDLEAAKVYQNQGELYVSLGKQDSAVHCLQLAANGFAKHEIWEENAWISITIAASSYYQAAYDSMEIYLEKAESLAKSHQLSNEVFDAIYELWGVLYFNTQKDYEKAIAATQRSLQLTLKNKKKDRADSVHIANIYNNIAVLYEQKGDLSRATHYYNLCLNIYDEHEVADEERALVLTNFGKTQFRLGHDLEAIHSYKKALHLLKNNLATRPKLGIKLCTFLGESYQQLEQSDSAQYFIDKAIHFAKRTEHQSNNALLVKAELLTKTKSYQNAIQLLTNVLQRDLVQEQGVQDLHEILKAYNQLGIIHLEQKAYKQALDYFQKALEANLPELEANSSIAQPETINEVYQIGLLVETLTNKAKTLEAQNKLASAFKNYQLAIDWVEKMRSVFTLEASKVRLNETTAALYKAALEVAYRLYASTQDTQYIQQAFLIAEKRKGILLLESLIDVKGKQHYGVAEPILERERQLKNDIAFYRQKMLEAKGKNDTTKFELYEGYYTDYSIQLAGLKDTLQTSNASYFKLAYQTYIADLSIVQQELLDKQQALIHYFATDSSIYIFLVEKDNSYFLRLSNNAQQKQNLQAFYANLNASQQQLYHNKDVFTNFCNLSNSTYEHIFAPVLEKLPTTSFIIIPDGLLAYLPFEALLPTPTNDLNIPDFIRLPYLLKDYQFHYGYSGTLLLENKVRYHNMPANDHCLALAPPYTSKASERGDSPNFLATRDEIAPLQGAAKEIQAIAKYFQGNFDYSASADEYHFKQQVSHYGILHLAMHGRTDLEQPDYAHLVFAEQGEKDSSTQEHEEDNLLHHYEIATLPIAAQLAVLSACETGVGKAIEGEGIMSLGRGFMYAGVPSVVMSLWKMNDLSTSELMPLFYENLSKGVRKDKALRQAKIDYLDNATMERAHPFYWAGFVGIGDAHPLKRTNSPTNWSFIELLVLIGCLLGGIIWFWKQLKYKIAY